MSLPSRGRGLKYFGVNTRSKLSESLPSRGRGLKSISPNSTLSFRSSLPSRGRGLKLKWKTHVKPLVVLVAPFAGAWIEIIYYNHINITSVCRSLRGGVD